MSIEEIEKQINNLPDIVEHKTCYTVYYNNIWHRMNPSDTVKVENFLKLVNIFKNFMHASLNQHKDTIDKIADLEKQVAELIKSDDKELLYENGDYPYEPNGDYPKHNE